MTFISNILSAAAPMGRLSSSTVLTSGHERDPGESERQHRDERWITTREGTAGSLALERACANIGFAPRIRYRTNDYDVVRSFVQAGLGIAAVPLLAYTPTPGIRAVRSPSLGVRRHVSVLRAQRGTNPAIDGMIRALSAAAASVSATW